MPLVMTDAMGKAASAGAAWRSAGAFSTAAAFAPFDFVVMTSGSDFGRSRAPRRSGRVPVAAAVWIPALPSRRCRPGILRSRPCGDTRYPPGGSTRSSASSCTGRRRRCPGSRRSTSTIGDWCSRATRDALGWSPYTEWYENSLRFPDSPVARHHREVYGDRAYRELRRRLGSRPRVVGPDEWAATFAATGARYVVLVTKHLDGYCLWPTDVPNPHRPGWQLRARRRRRARRGGARRGHALRGLLLGRARLDVQRSADRIDRRHARGDPARRLSRVRRRAGSRAHRPVPAERAVERHRLADRGQASCGRSSRTTTTRCPTAS